MSPVRQRTSGPVLAEPRPAAGPMVMRRAETVLRQRRADLDGTRANQERQLARASRLDRSEPHLASEAQVLGAQLAGTRLLLAEVDAALARIQEGTYGRCTSCLEDIPAARLEVMPHVRCCVGCQRTP